MVQCTIAASSSAAKDTHSPFPESVPLKLEEDADTHHQNENLRRYTIALCVVSVVINLVLCILGIVFAAMRRSPATFAFAADCVLDLLSSSVVIWRYFGSHYTMYSSSRENKACISLGVLFILAGFGVIIEGLLFLYLKDKPKWLLELLVLAGFGVVACVLLGVAKLILCRKINSKSLFLDALNSFLSALFALVIIISDVVYCHNKKIWYLDPVLSIIFSVALLAYGFQVILSHCRSPEEKPGF